MAPKKTLFGQYTRAELEAFVEQMKAAEQREEARKLKPGTHVFKPKQDGEGGPIYVVLDRHDIYLVPTTGAERLLPLVRLTDGAIMWTADEVELLKFPYLRLKT